MKDKELNIGSFILSKEVLEKVSNKLTEADTKLTEQIVIEISEAVIMDKVMKWDKKN